MSWREESPGSWQRPLGEVEAMNLEAITGDRSQIPRELIRIHCFADFTVSHDTLQVFQAFKDAWKALRLLKSPEIAATFANGNKMYKVPSKDEVDAWSKFTFIMNPIGTRVQEAVRAEQQQIQWLPVCHIVPKIPDEHTGDFKGTLILFISHWRTEASGAFKILNQIFEYAGDLLNPDSVIRNQLQQHLMGAETSLLAPTLEYLMMPGSKSTPEAQARVKHRFTEFSSKLPSIDFPLTTGVDPSAPPATDLVQQRIYKASITTSLLQSCKSRSISLTAAVNTALATSLWQASASTKKSLPWTCIMPAEARRRLGPDHPSRKQGCWNAAQMLLLSASPIQDFITNAQQLQQQYSLAASDQWWKEDLLETIRQFAEHFSGEATGDAAVAMAYITSMGLLDKDLLSPSHANGIKISRVSVWADSLGPGCVLGIWTFRGSLNLQVHWNKTFHRVEQVEELMDGIENVLEKELGVVMKLEDRVLQEF